MRRTRSVYFAEDSQKVRWTQSSSDGFVYNYKYVGEATENEFNILIDLLWYLHEEKQMTYEEFSHVYTELRMFCDRVMGLVDEL